MGEWDQVLHYKISGIPDVYGWPPSHFLDFKTVLLSFELRFFFQFVNLNSEVNLGWGSGQANRL